MLKTVGGSLNCWPLIGKKSVAHPEWEDTVLQDKKKDEEKRREEYHLKLDSRMVARAEGAAGFLCTKSRKRASVGRVGETTPMKRCEEKREDWARHWQCDTEAQDMEDEPWRSEDIEALRKGCQG